jgi:hypothetical protein
MHSDIGLLCDDALFAFDVDVRRLVAASALGTP